MTKTSQNNNLNYINFLKHFYEYHTEKLKYRDETCLILKDEHTAPLTYSLWFCPKTRRRSSFEVGNPKLAIPEFLFSRALNLMPCWNIF